MLYLARKEFPDRMMDDEDLDAIADLWRAWYERKPASRRGDWEVYQFLEIRLWGFARDRGAALVNVLKQRLASYGLPEPAVELPDPDTITVACPPVPVAD